ncbi:hypothetical protein GCM10023148_10930 [Actinokineospora soli]
MTGPDAGAALRALALDPRHRAAFQSSPELRAVLWPAAARFILAHDRAGLPDRLAFLAGHGYRIGLEFVGEEVSDPAEVEAVVAEYESLIETPWPGVPEPPRIGFDLSSVGSLISPDLAYHNTSRLLKTAATRDARVILSMENSAAVSGILEVYGELAQRHDNIALTVQSHLHRTDDDLAAVIAAGRPVRLVKGVYREKPEVALPRGPELDQRYLTHLRRLVDAGVEVIAATQDPAMHESLARTGLVDGIAEVEMLHGVRPDLLRALRDRGVPVRVLGVYGQNWWLHFLHRLAEHPPTVFTALADLADPTRVVFGRDYV